MKLRAFVDGAEKIIRDSFLPSNKTVGIGIVLPFYDFLRQFSILLIPPIICSRHPEPCPELVSWVVSGSMSYWKSEMLKKFQHDIDIAKVSIFDYGLWSLSFAKRGWEEFVLAWE